MARATLQPQPDVDPHAEMSAELERLLDEADDLDSKAHAVRAMFRAERKVIADAIGRVAPAAQRPHRLADRDPRDGTKRTHAFTRSVGHSRGGGTDTGSRTGAIDLISDQHVVHRLPRRILPGNGRDPVTVTLSPGEMVTLSFALGAAFTRSAHLHEPMEMRQGFVDLSDRLAAALETQMKRAHPLEQILLAIGEGIRRARARLALVVRWA